MSMPSDYLPEGEEKRSAVQGLFDTIAPRYDLVNRVMTLRMDVGWRKATVESLGLQPNSKVVDLACGTGDFCRQLDELGHFTLGIDLSLGMLQSARTGVPLIQGDLLRLPLAEESVDAAVCGFALRNLVDLEIFFDELARVVRPGGRIGLLDVSQPDNRLLAAGHSLYFNKAVPFIGGLLSDKNAYAYLPRSVSYLPPTETILSLLSTAGFEQVEHRQLSRGLSQLFTGERSRKRLTPKREVRSL